MTVPLSARDSRNSLRGFHSNGQLHFRPRTKRPRQTAGRRRCSTDLLASRANLIGRFNGIPANNAELCVALIKFSCKDRASRLDPRSLEQEPCSINFARYFLPLPLVIVNDIPSERTIVRGLLFLFVEKSRIKRRYR